MFQLIASTITRATAGAVGAKLMHSKDMYEEQHARPMDRLGIVGHQANKKLAANNQWPKFDDDEDDAKPDRASRSNAGVKGLLKEAIGLLTSINTTVKAQLSHAQKTATRDYRLAQESAFEARHEGKVSRRKDDDDEDDKDKEDGGFSIGKLLLALPIMAAIVAKYLNDNGLLPVVANKTREVVRHGVEKTADAIREKGTELGAAARETVSDTTDKVFGNTPEHHGHADRKRLPGGGDRGKAERERMVYKAFRKQGYSHEGALALSAEVGRENSFQEKFLFGGHKDQNKGQNIGFFSWQGPRRKQLEEFLKSKGLFKDGHIVKGQASLDAMAAFAKKEMSRDKGGRGLDEFLRKEHVDPYLAEQKIGKDFIRWDYTGRASQKKFGWDDAKTRRWVDKQKNNLREHYAEVQAATEAQKPQPKNPTKPKDARSKKGQKLLKFMDDGSNWISEDGGDWKLLSPEGKAQKLDSATKKKTASSTINNNTVINAPSTQMASSSPMPSVPSPSAGWGKDYHTNFGTHA
jgi:hypothetical protein